jgi:hypothetical protein
MKFRLSIIFVSSFSLIVVPLLLLPAAGFTKKRHIDSLPRCIPTRIAAHPWRFPGRGNSGNRLRTKARAWGVTETPFLPAPRDTGP